MELSILLAVQSIASPALDIVFTALSMLGESLVAATVLTLMYWVWDKELGEYVGFAVLTSLCVNGLIKNLVDAPRPIGQPGVRTVYKETATGTSFPSNHTQSAAALCGALVWRRKSAHAFWLLLIPVLIGLSRLYLGVHWPSDVLGGLALGLLVSAAARLLLGRLGARGREYCALGAAALFLAPAVLWGDSDFVKGYGLLAGFSVGTFLEHRLVRFSTAGTRAQKALRWLTGLALLGAVKILFDLLAPQTLLWEGLTYGAIAFTMTFLCPLAFRAWRLAGSTLEPNRE